MADVRRFAVGLVLTALLAYPLMFFIHKYLVPWTGHNDFRSYYLMVLHPFETALVPAPFAMRPITPLVARAILDLGLIYPNEIWFERFLEFQGRTYMTEVFFALIFANFLGTAAAGGLLYAALSRLDAGRAALVSPHGLLGIGLLLLAGTTVYYSLAPLTEGWTWFLITAIFLLLRRRDGWAYAALPLLALSIFQRELLSLMFAGLAACELVSLHACGREDRQRRRFLWAMLATGAAAAVTYVALRGYLLAVYDPHARQLDPVLWVANFVRWAQHRMFAFEFLQGALFKLNVLLLWAVVAALALRRGLPREERHALYALAALTVGTFWIAVATLTDRATDRLVAIPTPLFVLSTITLLARLNGPADGNAADP